MATIKTIGNSGQISLGKEFAGRHVLVDSVQPGVWTIKVGDFIPDSERWLHEPETKKEIEAGIKWAAENPPAETDLDELERKILASHDNKSH